MNAGQPRGVSEKMPAPAEGAREARLPASDKQRPHKPSLDEMTIGRTEKPVGSGRKR